MRRANPALPVPDCVELALAPLRLGNKVDVFNALDAANIVNSSGSYNLLQASIPVTTPGIHGDLRYAAATSDASRAYVPLELSQKIAVVDIVGQRQIDVNPTTSGIDSISLDPGSMPSAIVIGPEDEYAYVADRRLPAIYVIDIDPSSSTYNQRIQTINVDHAPNGIHQLALSHDGRRLFATAPGGGSSNNGEILVFDVDLNDFNQPGSKWNHQIGSVEAGSGLEGISSTSNANKMLFTNGGEDARGFGVLTINNNDANSFTATTTYTGLNLGSVNDYFDVNEGVAVTITSDGKYAFVAGRNGRLFGSGIPSIDDPKAGSNVGIIQDPLGSNPQLIAATRPIPMGLTNGLSLLSNDHYLYASYPGIGGTFVFDVQNLEKDLAAATPQQLALLASTPIDDVFSNIDLGADLNTQGGTNYNPNNDKNAPLITGGAPYSIAPVSTHSVINLQPITVEDASTLLPTFKWNFEGKEEGDTSTDCAIPESDKKIQEVDLYVSVFDNGNGLVPDVWKPKTLTPGVNDYNPNRILTAVWRDGTWTWKGGSVKGSDTQFTLPDERKLTAGQTYHWTVEAITDGEKKIVVPDQTFNTPLPTYGGNKFSSVTILTRGAELNGVAIDKEFEAMAQHIAQLDVLGVPDTSLGLVLDYNADTGKWDKDGTTNQVTVDDLNNDLGKSLVLLTGWNTPNSAIAFNSGASEAAADTFYASLVQLDQMLGGGIGDGAGNIYDNTGKLIRDQGELFNSYLHFIGFGQGAVVDDEIIQRLGTDYPLAGGAKLDDMGKIIRGDLQMTTIDPNDQMQASLNVDLKNLNEPQIKVWNNITFADNYYQEFSASGKTNTRMGEAITDADLNVDLSTFAGFGVDDGQGGLHDRALAWYAGTLNLTGSTIPSLGDEKVYRRLGDLDADKRTANSDLTWYSPDYAGYDFDHGSEKAPWEGIGIGWFYSALGGGMDLRPYEAFGSKYSLDDIKTTFGARGFEGYLDDRRNPVSEDNTTAIPGDYPVPTLFNGNFDAITKKLDGQNLPGWYDDNSDNQLKQSALVDVTNISGATAYSNGVPNYALLLGGGNPTSATHNPFVIPDWGNLRFDVYAPQQSGKLNVTLQTIDGYSKNVDINLDQDANSTIDSSNRNNIQQIQQIYLDNQNNIGFGRRGFETFQLNLQLDDSEIKEFRGKPATLTFSLDGGNEVYIDNVFFKSDYLKFGNPTDARWVTSSNADSSNLLLEKPQYVVSYNANTKIANWVGWEVDSSWVTRPQLQPGQGLTERPEFVADPDLTPTSLPTYNGNIFTGLGMDRGHLIPDRDRARDPKDQLATYLTTNLIAQSIDNNRFFVDGSYLQKDASAWSNIENRVVQRVIQQGQQLYIFAGAFGNNTAPQVKTNAPEFVNEVQNGVYFNKGNTIPSNLSTTQINIPQWTWKTIIVLDKPGAKITENTTTYTFLTPNSAEGTDPNNTQLYSSVPITWPQPHPFNNLFGGNRVISSAEEWRDPSTWRISLSQLEQLLNSNVSLSNGQQFDFLSNVPENIRNILKQQGEYNPNNPLSASLQAEVNPATEEGLSENVIPTNLALGEIRIKGETGDKNSVFPNNIPEITGIFSGATKLGTLKVDSGEISTGQIAHTSISPSQITVKKSGISQVAGLDTNISQITVAKFSPQIAIPQLDTTQVDIRKSSTSQADVSQFNTTQVSVLYQDPLKISTPSSISPKQVLSSNSLQFHTLTPESITTINDTAQTLWNTLLAPTTPFDINLQLTSSLAKGQLAEAIITKYDSLGRPIGGTIEVDPTANGLGWFIDPTITDPSEFSQTLSKTASRATTNSNAYGHYDLLTALLHEMAHLAGFISGNSGFDSHVQIVNGSRLFVGDNFTAPLTNDGSHLDTKTYAYDLLNPTLTPGIRELPSQIDVEILKEVRSADNVVQITPTQAALTSAPLTEILNGKFDTSDTTDPNYGWTTRGAATVLNKEAVLTEDSPLNSEFKQTFTVPQGAKYLEFTLKDATLGDDSADSPGDAFEVALLDANEKTSLVDTNIGLTRTDSFLNIQHDGQMYYGSNLIVPKTTTQSVPMTFKVDLSGIQPGTTATLYFDLLGFGNHDAKITIDNVELLNSDTIPPVANNNTASTDAGKPVVINVLANDTSNQTIDPTSIAIANNPTNGNIIVDKDGTLAYTPNNNFVGTDTFTYTVANSDGTTSNPATVKVTVNDVAPIITDLPVTKKVYQQDPTNFTATAITTGDNHLTYIWDFGDGTAPQQGNTVEHTFAQSGEYNTTLTVIDAYGLKDTKTVTVYVGSTAPTEDDDQDLPDWTGDFNDIFSQFYNMN